MSSGLTPGGRNHSAPVRAERGFTVIEALVVVAIVFVMTAIALPLVQSTLAYYDLQAAVSGVSGAIQSTRFQAISSSYPYKITFSKATNTYQLERCPSWNPTVENSCKYEKYGSAIPFASAKVALGDDEVLIFRASGAVEFDTGANPIKLSRDLGNSKINTKSITVSSYGSVKVE